MAKANKNNPTYGLHFISDEDLYNHTAETVNKYRFNIDLKAFNKNLIDPIKLSFDSMVYQRSFSNEAVEMILEDEIRRQMDKSNTNHIGYFHQNIFKYIGQNKGWEVPKQGFDIENNILNIFVEMKNKHNTMNSSSSAKTYMRMQNKILQNSKATCMLVEIIAKNSQNIQWKCSIDNDIMENERIRRVSIDKFYEIVTEDENAFAKLCQVLPKVIADVVKNNKENLINNTVVNELKNLETNNLLQNLYLFAFKKYQGFNHFNFTN